MRLPAMPADIEADITFLATAQGGRQGFAHSGYRACHDLGLATLNDAVHEYLAGHAAAPGATTKARMWLLDPEGQRGRLHAGFRFTVQEGARVVGQGVVTNVVNPDLQTSSR